MNSSEANNSLLGQTKTKPITTEREFLREGLSYGALESWTRQEEAHGWASSIREAFSKELGA